jgi:hypothetical protein
MRSRKWHIAVKSKLVFALVPIAVQSKRSAFQGNTASIRRGITAIGGKASAICRRRVAIWRGMVATRGKAVATRKIRVALCGIATAIRRKATAIYKIAVDFFKIAVAIYREAAAICLRSAIPFHGCPLGSSNQGRRFVFLEALASMRISAISAESR